MYIFSTYLSKEASQQQMPQSFWNNTAYKPMYIFSTYLSKEVSQPQMPQSFWKNIAYNPCTVVIRSWKNTFDATILDHTSLKNQVFNTGPT